MDNNQSNSVWAQSIPVKEQLSVIKRLAKMAGFVKWKFIFSGLLVLLFSLVQALLPWMLGEFIDTGLTKENTTLQTVLYFAMIFTGIRVITSFVSYFQNQIYQDAAESALNEVRRRLYQKLHSLGMRYFDQTPGGSLVTRVMNDTESFFDFWFLFSTLITTVTSVIFAYIFMYQADAKLALWLLIFLPIILASIWLYQRVSSGVYRRMRERLSSLNAKLAESINGISTIKSFHQESRITDEYLDINQQYYNARVSMIKNDARLLGPLNQLLQGIAVVVIYLYLGQTSIRGLIAAGSAYVFISLATNIFSPLSNLQQQMSSFQDGVVSGYRAGKILDETEYEPSQNAGADKTITDGRIEFKNVNFSYDDKNVILKNLSFVAEPGQTVALVGHTGSGKSSTINALMRFYEFQSGQILIDGQDIRDLDMTDFRRKTGLVLQDAFMFFGDIKSN
ncbi:MAG: ABC transporter ATP-binding protein/permease, partial [Lactobacillaceae bacterium]|nr:ABC transporter ATP-binding protein/permease [Lactobacillaceae bacterium]